MTSDYPRAGLSPSPASGEGPGWGFAAPAAGHTLPGGARPSLPAGSKARPSPPVDCDTREMSGLAALRERVRRIERGAAALRGAAPLGIAAIDRLLPQGGLPLGALHEILGTGGDEEDGALAAAFAAVLVARLGDGPVLWCLKRPDLYGPGLAACGLDPARLVLVRARRDAEVLWAIEEGLRIPALAAAIGEVGVLSLVASRRLQLAAERSGVTAFLLRRWHDGDAAARQRGLPTAAATRWRIAAAPRPEMAPLSARNGGGRGWLAPARWRVELLRCRGGAPAAWEVEVADATGAVSVAAALADRPALAEAVRQAG